MDKIERKNESKRKTESNGYFVVCVGGALVQANWSQVEIKNRQNIDPTRHQKHDESICATSRVTLLLVTIYKGQNEVVKLLVEGGDQTTSRMQIIRSDNHEATVGKHMLPLKHDDEKTLASFELLSKALMRNIVQPHSARRFELLQIFG